MPRVTKKQIEEERERTLSAYQQMREIQKTTAAAKDAAKKDAATGSALHSLAYHDMRANEMARLLEQDTGGMSDAQRAILEMAQRELARRKLLVYTMRMYPQYKPGWVHEDICRRLERFLEDVVAGKSPRLMICMPPRHGKSELATLRFAAWALGKYDWLEIIACSYGSSLAEGFSKKVKAQLGDAEYEAIFPGVRVDPNNGSNEGWSLHGKKGGYVAAGVGGPVTGKGAHILIIDDPVKNQEEADSEATKQGIWDWYGSTAYTRLAPGGGVLVIQTLWAEDDLAGRLQEAMAQADPDDPDVDRFEVIKYPAIAEQHEYICQITGAMVKTDSALTEDQMNAPGAALVKVRAPGDALHPERYDIRALRRIKNTVAERWWNCLYQQDPNPPGGTFFKKEWWRLSPVPDKKDCNVCVSWDFAISEKRKNDYTVGTVHLLDEYGFRRKVDQIRMQTEDSFRIVSEMINLGLKWHVKGRIFRMGVENGQIWKTLKHLFLAQLRQRNATHLLAGLVENDPITDKSVRATPLQGIMKSGTFLYPDPKPDWFEEDQAEKLKFPNGKNDDIVDSDAWNVITSLDMPLPEVRTKKTQTRKAGYGLTKENMLKELNKLSRNGSGGGHMSR